MLDTIKDCAKNSVTWTITSTKGLVQIARGDFKKGLETVKTGVCDGLTFGIFSHLKNKNENSDKVEITKDKYAELLQKEKELKKLLNEQEKEKRKEVSNIVPPKPKVVPIDRLPQNIRKILYTESEYLEGIEKEAFVRIDGKGNKDGKVNINEAFNDLNDSVLSTMKDKDKLIGTIKEVLEKYAGTDGIFSAQEWAKFLNGKEWNDVLAKYQLEQMTPNDKIPSSKEMQDAIKEC